MKTDEFDYDLPSDRIAYYPLSEREHSNLLLLNKENGSIDHKHFYDISSILKQDDLLVLNNTKVIPARLTGKSENRAEIELLLIQKIESHVWQVLLKRPKEGIHLDFGNGISGEINKSKEYSWNIKFNVDIENYLTEIGNMPLPPYIERAAEKLDKERYQTVYAKAEGAIAAPTAGLHFSSKLLNEILNKGIQIEYVTLHVGIGTFRPVKTEFVEDHSMH
ncbi:MAG: S-adenosylmethionine:tRNA ribosyltransferase-isomerase, partial [Thermodesulfobacteriota bacterium]